MGGNRKDSWRAPNFVLFWRSFCYHGLIDSEDLYWRQIQDMFLFGQSILCARSLMNWAVSSVANAKVASQAVRWKQAVQGKHCIASKLWMNQSNQSINRRLFFYEECFPIRLGPSGSNGRGRDESTHPDNPTLNMDRSSQSREISSRILKKFHQNFRPPVLSASLPR